jgi:HAD superfamily hydrolase (TIGR01459 family)
MIEIVSSIAPVSQGTRAWFVDIWGVIHDGIAPFASAVDACVLFRRQGGIVVLVSNAPRPSASVATQLDRIGVPRDAYDGIVSSGDASRAMIKALGPAPIYHLGPERDLALYEGLAVVPSAAADAQAVVCTGLFDDETETPRDYLQTLTGFAARNVAMICANPDLAVERGGRIIPCAGAVAALYTDLGGQVSYAGKPHLPIYDATFALVTTMVGQSLNPESVLAIGDGVHTDIAGAARAGIRSVYIASAVNLGAAPLDHAALARLFPVTTGAPVAAMTALAW